MKNFKIKNCLLLFTILSILCGVIILTTHLIWVRAEIIVQEKEPIKEAIEDTIKRVCDEQEVPWIQCILVAHCESKKVGVPLDRYFKEKMVLKDGTITYDRGVFAINSYYFSNVPDDCAFDPECATKIFVENYKNGDAGKWNCYAPLFGKQK